MNEYLRLDECCQIEISSIDKKTKSNEEPVKLCNFTDVYRNWNIYSSMIDSFMNATASKKNIDTFSLNRGDVVITKDSETRDDIGMSALIYDDLPNTVLGYHCALIRPKKLITGSFLNAYLNSYLGRKYFENQASGSGQRYTLTKEALGSILIPMLPMEQQTVIGNFFSDIDKKIKINNEIISELESLAKTIYDYWFLQFEFPNEDGKPYKSSGGKMVWNKELKREIPEGWDSSLVGDVLGNYPKTTSVQKEDYKTKGKYPIIDQSRDFICGYTDDNDKVLSLNDVIVYGDHTNTVKYVNFDFARGADGTQIINSNSANIPNCLLYQQIKDLPIIEKGYSRHFKFVKAQHILVPSNKIAVEYADLMSTTYKYIAVAICENKELASLRDFLLPMLMNGQVTFKD